MRSLIILAYLINFFIGINASLGGVTLIEMAKSFSVDTYIINYMFTLAAVGNGLTIFFTRYLLEKWDFKKIFALAISCIILGYIGITSVNYLISFAFFVFVCGLGLGILSYMANYLVVNLYKNNDRTTKLSTLNFFFSFGAVMTPIIAGVLLKNNIKWEAIYQSLSILLLFLFILVLNSKNVLLRKAVSEKSDCEIVEKWGVNVYIIGVALIFYILAEFTFSSWIFVYLREDLLIDIIMAGGVPSIFAMFMAIGRLLSGIIVGKFKVERFIMTFAIFAVATYLILLSVRSIYSIFILTAIMGLWFSGLYAAIFSYGTMQLKNPSTKLITFYMTVGTIGMISCFLFTSAIKNYFGVYFCLIASACSLVVVILLIAITIILTREIGERVNS